MVNLGDVTERCKCNYKIPKLGRRNTNFILKKKVYSLVGSYGTLCCVFSSELSWSHGCRLKLTEGKADEKRRANRDQGSDNILTKENHTESVSVDVIYKLLVHLWVKQYKIKFKKQSITKIMLRYLASPTFTSWADSAWIPCWRKS